MNLKENISPNRGKGKAIRSQVKQQLLSDYYEMKRNNSRMRDIGPELMGRYRVSESAVYRILR